jgi:hypothetical protein
MLLSKKGMLSWQSTVSEQPNVPELFSFWISDNLVQKYSILSQRLVKGHKKTNLNPVNMLFF